MSEAFGEAITGESRAVSPRDHEYHSARDELVAEGRSSDGAVEIAVRGMREWTVRIADGTLRRLNEQEFAPRFAEAAAELIRDQSTKIRALKNRIYG